MIPNYRRKYCPRHAKEAVAETARRQRYNQRRQAEADRMRAAIQRKQ